MFVSFLVFLQQKQSRLIGLNVMGFFFYIFVEFMLSVCHYVIDKVFLSKIVRVNGTHKTQAIRNMQKASANCDIIDKICELRHYGWSHKSQEMQNISQSNIADQISTKPTG